ncbi:pectinesterase family protein [Gracilibacillus marinus]|uniref:Pectinesterase family protein n=1 Tax=Gracilibacillus marinus TaxID=630535 RepID=A0ABV8VQE8_9BACI
MLKKGLVWFLILLLVLPTMPLHTHAEGTVDGETEETLVPAFPGAEGGGKYTTGGRNGDVYFVTNLNDSGPGSLREGVARDNTTIIFRVGGTIELKSRLKLTGTNVTIAGQTAPGDGITITGYDVAIEADNIILRHLRFRLGDKNAIEADALGGRYYKNIIIDHCSFSWSVDEVLSLYANMYTTVQHSIISEAMLMTAHQKGRHGYGGIQGGYNAAFHHNLMAHNFSRNPRFPGVNPPLPDGHVDSVDFQHNIIYNWGLFASYGGENGQNNLANNYYKPGVNTYASSREMLFVDMDPRSNWFVNGNIMDGSPEVTQDNWKGVNKYTDVNISPTLKEMDYPLPAQTANQAYNDVLANSGATMPRRDAIDARIVNEVKNGTGHFINSQKEVGGYPAFREVVSDIVDEDKDGMPDDWEEENGFDPSDPDDRNGDTDNDGYTNLEEYLNSIEPIGTANPSVFITNPKMNDIKQAGSQLKIEVDAADSDGTIEKVQFYKNDELIGEDETAPYAYEVTNLPKGTHHFTAKAIDNSLTSTDSSNVIIHVNQDGDITPWEGTDIGEPAIKGHTELSADEVTIKSSGNIYGSKDEFHFAHQELTGNGEIIAKVESITATDDGAEAGVMIRDALTEDAKMIATTIAFGKGGKVGQTLTRKETGASLSKIINDGFIDTPYWVKVTRIGDQFTSSISENGITWKKIDTQTLSLNETVYIGLIAHSAEPEDQFDKLNTSTFSNVTIEEMSGEYPLPPQNVTVTPGENRAILEWNKVESADSYIIKQGTQSSGPYEVIQEVTETSYTVENLTAGKQYYYVISAKNQFGESFHSKEKTVTPTGTPETIMYLDDHFEDGNVNEQPVDYLVEPNPQTDQMKVIVTDVPDESEGNTSLQTLKLHDEGNQNVKFTKTFAAQKGKFVVEFDFMQPKMAGTSKVLQLQNATGSRTPISIELRKPDGEDSYTFVWSNNGNHKIIDTPVDHRWYHFIIEADVQSGTADIYINNQLVSNDIPFNGDVKEDGISRMHAATPGGGTGSFYMDNIKVYTEPISSPKSVKALEGDGEVKLEWLETSDATHYQVKRATSIDGPFEVIADHHTTTEFTDKTVENNQTYYYVITAVADELESDASPIVQATPSGSPNEEFIVQDDFEEETLNEAPTNYQVGPLPQNDINKVIVTEVPTDSIGNTSNKVLKLHDEGGTNVTFDKVFQPQRGTVIVEMDFMQPSMAGTSRFFRLHNEAGNKTAISLELRKPAGENDYTFVYSYNGAYVKLADVPENNRWYRFKIVANTTTSTADIYIDDELVAEAVPFSNDLAEDGIGRIASSTPGGGSGHMYFDNISIYTEPVKAPEGLDAIIGNKKVQLLWDVSDGAISYNVKRSEQSGEGYITIAKDVVETTYIDEELVNGKTYYYVISSNSDRGESQYSEEIAVKPSENPPIPEAPSELVVTPRNTQVNLKWEAVDYATSYVVKRATQSDGPYEVVEEGITTTHFTDTGLTNGTTYYYVVVARHIGGDSLHSSYQQVTPIEALATPMELTVLPEDNAMTIEWQAVEDATKYDVQRASNSDGPFESIGVTTETIFRDTELRNGTPYYYVVTAKNDQVISLTSEVKGMKPKADDGTPYMPGNLLLSNPDDGDIEVKWDEVKEADSYIIKRRIKGDMNFEIVASDITTTSFIDTNVVENETYEYIVQAVNNHGVGYSSEIMEATAAIVWVVAKDGSRDFTSIQAAIDAVPNNNDIRTIIQLIPDMYEEKVKITREKTMLSLIGLGENPEDTLIIHDDNAKTIGSDGNEIGTTNTYTVLAQADDFIAGNLTIENASGNDTSQAIALSARGDRQVYRNVRLIGWQDTLLATDDVRQYYVDSYISGDVDFIFGDATAVFNRSIIHARDGGYVTAASTQQGKIGYVFINSKLTKEEGLTNKVDLGRPWRPYSNVVYINTWMDDHIKPQGWNNWGNQQNELTARYYEYASSGPGGDVSARQHWAKQLTKEEAETYLPENVLAGKDNWNPVKKQSYMDSNSLLSEITVNGELLSLFEADTYAYTVTLPSNTVEVPLIDAQAMSEGSEITVTQAESIADIATIEVIAEDGTTLSYTIQFSEKLQAPEDVQTVQTEEGIEIKWNKVDGAVTYLVKRSTTSGKDYETIATIEDQISMLQRSATLSYMDKEVTANTPYYYVIVAIDANGVEGDTSKEIQAIMVKEEVPDDNETPEETPDVEEGNETPEETPDGEEGNETPEETPDGEGENDLPEESQDGEEGNELPEETPDGEEGNELPSTNLGMYPFFLYGLISILFASILFLIKRRKINR